MFVLDSHCDTPSQLKRLRDLGADNETGHVDYPKLIQGNVDASFFAIYVPASMTVEDGYKYADELIDLVEESVEDNGYDVRMARSVDEALTNKANGYISIMLGLENGSPLGDDLRRVKHFYDRGVRYITLCHSRDNQICDSCADGHRWGGLSQFGREVVAEMNRLGILVDVSHISDESFYDVLEASSCPVVATHSCCRKVSNHPRNMTDEMMLALAEKGGVIQINFYPVFLDKSWGDCLDVQQLMDDFDVKEERFIANPADSETRRLYEEAGERLLAIERPSYKEVVDHIDHAVSIVGWEHVGIGSDFDGICVPPIGLENVSKMGIIFEEMRRRGYSEEQIEAIAGKNFLRVLNQAKLS